MEPEQIDVQAMRHDAIGFAIRLHKDLLESRHATPSELNSTVLEAAKRFAKFMETGDV